jgi:hypothetical protein
MAGWAWWRRDHQSEMSSSTADLGEVERLLDLAGFADRRLDEAAYKRIAALVARDPAAATDVAAARALGSVSAPPADRRVIARAAALIVEPGLVDNLAPIDDTGLAGGPGGYGQVIVFPRPQPSSRHPHGAAAWRWSSLAAAIAVASWLGFDLGSGMPPLEPQLGHTIEDAATGSLFDPAPPLLRDFTEGWQT